MTGDLQPKSCNEIIERRARLWDRAASALHLLTERRQSSITTTPTHVLHNVTYAAHLRKLAKMLRSPSNIAPEKLGTIKSRSGARRIYSKLLPRRTTFYALCVVLTWLSVVAWWIKGSPTHAQRPPAQVSLTARHSRPDTGAICFAVLRDAVDGETLHAFERLESLAVQLAEQGERVNMLEIAQVDRVSSLRPLDNNNHTTAPIINKVVIQQSMPWFRGMPVTRPAMALLEHLRERSNPCSQLHTIDRHGLGFYVAQAKRAGLREFASMQVITHAVGGDIFSPHKMPWDEHKKRRLNDVFRAAQERIVVENSDAVIFSTQTFHDFLAAKWKLPQAMTFVVDTNQHTPSTRAYDALASPQPIDTIVLAAQMLDHQAGLKLLYQACARLSPAVREHTRSIVFIGNASTGTKGAIKTLQTAFQRIGLAVTLHTWQEAMEDDSIWDTLIPRSVFVFPSWLDRENQALVKALELGARVIVSNIAYHLEVLQIARADDARHLGGIVFELRDVSLGQALARALTENKQVLRRQSKGARVVKWNANTTTAVEVICMLMDKATTTRNHLQHSSKIKTLDPITVIIPFCDRTEYLDSAIHSVANNQRHEELTPSTHVLLVAACPTQKRCVDAGMLHTHQFRSLSSLRCLESSATAGSLGAARNFGLLKSTTDLNVFLDDDDELDVRALYDLSVAARLNPHIGHFSSFADIFYDDGRAGDAKKLDARWSLIGPSPEVATIVNAVGFANMMVRKSAPVIKDRQGFSTDLSLGSGCEDWEIVAVAAFLGETMLVPTRTYWYRKKVDRGTGQVQGMLAEIGQDEMQPSLCRLRVLKAVAKYTKLAWIQPLAQYSQAMYEKYDNVKW